MRDDLPFFGANLTAANLPRSYTYQSAGIWNVRARATSTVLLS